MWLQAPNIACNHGFSTRHGGISSGLLQSLNLGGSLDDPETIAHNRQIALRALGLNPANLRTLKQVHGNLVHRASEITPEGDALVSNNPMDVLAISIADCYPILFHDPENGVIGAAHAGWRGTVSSIAGKTIEAMCDLGANRASIQVAIGQGICQDKFEVGPEVTDAFKKAGFPDELLVGSKVDLVACNLFILHQHNILPENTWAMRRCTFESDFFSHRRDKGVTGRMWGVISLSEHY